MFKCYECQKCKVKIWIELVNGGGREPVFCTVCGAKGIKFVCGE